MLVMGIESSTTVASVSVSDKNKILGEFTIDTDYTHSEKLMPLIEKLLNCIDINIKDIDCFLISNGPGSFTGLRIGMTIAKSLAYSLDKNIVGISTLKTIAYNLKYSDKLIVPMIDARNSRVFTGVFRSKEGIITEILEEEAIEVSGILEKLKSYDEEIVFVGEGASIYKKEISENISNPIFITGYQNIPKAGNICDIFFSEKLEITDNYFSIIPNYLRPSQAQRQKEEKNS